MAHTDYPINFHILAEDFRGKQVMGYSQSEAAWLHESLTKMCEAYDETVDTPIPVMLSKWCAARLKDSRESGEIDTDVSDAVIEREAEKLEIEIHKVASSFVDNDFNEKE